MAYPVSLLTPGETIIKQMRPHWRALLLPIFVFIVVATGWGVLFTVFSFAPLRWAVAIIGVVVFLFFVLIPLLKWYSSEYVFTDRRVITRKGIIAKSGRDVPLDKINNVSFSKTIWGRFLNYGDLVIDSANSDGPVTISDVPSVEEIQRDLYASMENDRTRGAGGSSV